MTHSLAFRKHTKSNSRKRFKAIITPQAKSQSYDHGAYGMEKKRKIYGRFRYFVDVEVGLSDKIQALWLNVNFR